MRDCYRHYWKLRLILRLGFLMVLSVAWDLRAEIHNDVTFLNPFVVEANTPKAKAHPLPLYGFPLLQSWTAPEYPKDARRQNLSGSVKLRLLIDARGTITDTKVLEYTDARFVGPSQDAAKHWQFSPALNANRPVSLSLDVQIIFSPDNPYFKGPSSQFPPDDLVVLSRSPIVEAALISTPDVDYPDSLFDRKLSGWAHFSCTVLPDGRAANPRIVATTHVDFVAPALKALETLKYSPRRTGDTPIEASVEGNLKFDLFRKDKIGVLEANHIAAPNGDPPVADIEPDIVVDPIFPYELLIHGESGSATVRFTVNESGFPKEVFATSSSDLAFGKALVAAIEMCRFSPPILNGHSVKVELQRKEAFGSATAKTPSEKDTISRLLAAVHSGQVKGAQGLDEELTPLYRVSPGFPEMSGAATPSSGEAVIEFIIDRDGRARLPRVISATREEFGWSAATAVGQWVFRAPTRGKLPVDVKVRINFQFKAPQQQKGSQGGQRIV